MSDLVLSMSHSGGQSQERVELGQRVESHAWESPGSKLGPTACLSFLSPILEQLPRGAPGCW